MAQFVALLRGINVGGRRPICMGDLRALAQECGLSDVRTYLQSGNLIFDGGKRSGRAIVKLLQDSIQAHFGVNASVILRTPGELSTIHDRNPFAQQACEDPTRVHVTFLATRPAPGRVRKMRIPEAGRDAFSVLGQEVFVHCPGGYGRTKLNNAYFERELETHATTRNYKTVRALNELIAGA